MHAAQQIAVHLQPTCDHHGGRHGGNHRAGSRRGDSHHGGSCHPSGGGPSCGGRPYQQMHALAHQHSCASNFARNHPFAEWSA
jgi:hypothetical protein